MAQSPEAQKFLDGIAALHVGPGVSLDGVLAKAIEDETVLRRLYANDRSSKRLENPYVGLVSVFDAPDAIRKTRARVVKDKDDLDAKHIFPLPDNKRRKDDEPSMVENLQGFQKNWAIFSEGSLSQLTDWSNVIAAGGSVLGCLLPLSEKDKESKRTLRKYFHSEAYPTSDVDLFIWGLTPEQAEARINSIYEAVRDSVPWDVTCIRTKSAITIYSQYPYRCIQIVLRLYQSPAEVLAGFDVDAPCVAYDGTRVYANPRSIVAMMRQANTVDMTRRSPSYEIRLAKYASRGFEIYVPDLRRKDIDPTIFERSLVRIEGLARLLVLERLSDPDARNSYLESRRSLRSRPNATAYSRRMMNRQRKRKGDLKADEGIAGLEMSDYDTAILHIPYGPGWTAKRIDKLIYQTDLGTNSTFNPKNKDRRLHRHVAFFGTMMECIEDCCGYCPEPITEEEKALQEKEDKTYIHGRISFIQEDPGRQTMSGSFNPIDVGEWSAHAYLGPTEKLFNAIVAHDRETIREVLQDETLDINRRDPVGRTPLHVAVLVKAEEICCDLIDAGARMTPRLASGRTALHIAAQMNSPVIIKKLLAQSALNEQKAKDAEEEKEREKAEAAKKQDDEVASDSDEERPSSVDDWSSDEDDEKRTSKAAAKRVIALNEQPALDEGDIPEDEMNTPDILDINAPDWDLRFTPLAFAVVSGALDAVEALLDAGVDPKQAIMAKPNDYNSCTLHPLTLATIITDENVAGEIVDRLLRAGASSSQADSTLFSVFHAFVNSGKRSLVEKLLVNDPTSKAALNIPSFGNGNAVYPLVTATARSMYAITAMLLAYGANASFSPDDIDKAKKLSSQARTYHYYGNDKTPNPLDYLNGVYLPVETSLAAPNYLYHLLAKSGAQINVPLMASHSSARYDHAVRRSLVEVAQLNMENATEKILSLENKLEPKQDITAPENPKTWAEYRLWTMSKLAEIRRQFQKGQSGQKKVDNETMVENQQKRDFYADAVSFLQSENALTWDELYPDMPRDEKNASRKKTASSDDTSSQRVQYKLLRAGWGTDMVLLHLLDSYDELFEACWAGDNAKIQELCLPPKKGLNSSRAPLQISVKCTGAPDNSGTLTSSDGEHTPLSVAVAARRWDTAKLIMEIAAAQWKKPEKDAGATRKFQQAIDLNDDGSDTASEGGGCESCEDSDYDIDDDQQDEPTILDLAARPTAVRCDVSPEKFFNESISARPFHSEDRKITGSHSVFLQACCEGDLEAFLQLTDIASSVSVPIPQPPTPGVLLRVLEGDSIEILDRYIRRTGVGLPIEALSTKDGKEESEDELEQKAREAELSKRLYLGLSIHGKKRKDLAKRGDVHAQNQDSAHIPLLWDAIRSNAFNIVDYLHGPRPLQAYRAFAEDNSSENAEAIRRLSDEDLAKVLPSVLGLVPNSRQENAVTAAILGGSKPLEMTKKLLALNPKHAQEYLHSAIRYVKMTPLLLATHTGRDIEYIDFLLFNGVATEVADAQGNNLLHIVCTRGNIKLLQHYLEKLPEESLERLVRQRNCLRGDGMTPLMLAANGGRLDIVKQLLESKLSAVKATIPIRNARGLNVIHLAVQRGNAKILSELLKHCDEDLLYTENTVGESPLETAELLYLLEATQPNKLGWRSTINTLPYRDYDRSTIFVRPETALKALETQVADYVEVKAKLTSQDKFSDNQHVRNAYDEFEVFLRAKVDNLRKFAEANPPQEDQSTPTNSLNTYVPFGMNYAHTGPNVDTLDRRTTLDVVLATAKSSRKRTLVHILDVQQSVINSLEKAVAPRDDYYQYNESRQWKRFNKAEELPKELEKEKIDSREQWKGVLSWAPSLQRNLV